MLVLRWSQRAHCFFCGRHKEHIRVPKGTVPFGKGLGEPCCVHAKCVSDSKIKGLNKHTHTQPSPRTIVGCRWQRTHRHCPVTGATCEHTGTVARQSQHNCYKVSSLPSFSPFPSSLCSLCSLSFLSSLSSLCSSPVLVFVLYRLKWLVVLITKPGIS